MGKGFEGRRFFSRKIQQISRTVKSVRILAPIASVVGYFAKQGEQIGRCFASCMIIYLGLFFEKINKYSKFVGYLFPR
jgi:hypothetical protein